MCWTVCNGGNAFVHVFCSWEVFFIRSINSRGGFGLHQINPLVRFSSMKCKNLRLRSFVVRSRSGSDPKSKIINKSVDFPKDYNELVNQARRAAQAALKDDKTLLEVEFPTAGLDTVPGE